VIYKKHFVVDVLYVSNIKAWWWYDDAKTGSCPVSQYSILLTTWCVWTVWIWIKTVLIHNRTHTYLDWHDWQEKLKYTGLRNYQQRIPGNKWVEEHFNEIFRRSVNPPSPI
jgi:hypothetical protein